MAPFPVEVRHKKGRGRCLHAARALAAGEIALRVLPLALAVSDEQLERLCAGCAALPTSCGLLRACSRGCGYRWCASCESDARRAAIHAAGECVSVGRNILFGFYINSCF